MTLLKLTLLNFIQVVKILKFYREATTLSNVLYKTVECDLREIRLAFLADQVTAFSHSLAQQYQPVV